ncbi:MAG: sugar nucleotide-binding protein [Proteobacteria bacterium]|nr:sugar nucleotide-binding protein [Pseudomonadota bacterium]MDA1037770.1 sugar nucleotide-binding protein [Pseudomonadota bacterium]
MSDITIKALYLIDKKNCEYGIYHYGGNESCSWYEFAEYIFDEAKNYNFKIPDINEIPSSSYPTQANRPKYSVLNSSKAINKFEVSASNWKTGVRVAIENININSSQA